MTNKFLVGYDGSQASERAVDFAVEQANECGASLLVVHVLEWSPYSFLTPDELEERHRRKKAEVERAEKALMEPLAARLKDAGCKIETQIRYGRCADVLIEVAEKEKVTQVFFGRQGESGLASRVFGSVAGSLAQSASVPCTIVP